MVLNRDKCPKGQTLVFFIIFDKHLVSNIVTIKKSKVEKVLEVTFDSKLDFSPHLNSFTKRANIKLNVITRLQIYMTPEQKTFLFYNV